MNLRGQCFENTVADLLKSTLTRECLPVNRKLKLRKEGISKINNWLLYYNGLRPHSAMGIICSVIFALFHFKGDHLCQKKQL